jgi:hypothetical protein
MKDSNDLTNQIATNLQKIDNDLSWRQQQTQAQQTPPTGGQVNHKQVNELYDSLKSIYGPLKWDQTFKNDLELNKSKLMFSEDISLLTNQQVLDGIDELKRRKENFDPTAGWPDIAYVIGCCKNGKPEEDWKPHSTAAYKPFQQDMKHLTHQSKLTTKEQKRAFTDAWRKEQNISRVQPKGNGRGAKRPECMDEDGNFIGLPGHPQKYPKTEFVQCPNPHTHPEEYEQMLQLKAKQDAEIVAKR